MYAKETFSNFSNICYDATNIEQRQKLNIGTEYPPRCFVSFCIVEGPKSATPAFIFVYCGILAIIFYSENVEAKEITELNLPSGSQLWPRSPISGYFRVRNLFIPDSKISSLTHYRIRCGFVAHCRNVRALGRVSYID